MKVVYDNACPVCRSFKAFAEERVTEENASFIPLQSAEVNALPGVSRAEARASLIVRTANGQTRRGVAAVAEVLKKMSGLWGIAGMILTIPPVRWAAEPLY